jgi:transcriptional regulator with XRE-family HTH domain
MNKFGQLVRKLRQAKALSLRDVAPKVGVGFTYLSKIENGKLDFGDYPSEALIRKLAEALDADEDELMLLAEKMPDQIRRRVVERPDVFLMLAGCDDKALDKVKVQIATSSRRRKGRPRKPR